MFSHSNQNRALETKTPPPLGLGAESRRAEMHAALSGTRAGLGTAVRQALGGQGSWIQLRHGTDPKSGLCELSFDVGLVPSKEISQFSRLRETQAASRLGD